MSAGISFGRNWERLESSLDRAIGIALACESKGHHERRLPLMTTDYLTSLLYRRWYVRPESCRPCAPLPQRHWSAVFRAAHRGTYRLERGWIAIAVSDTGRVAAVRNGEKRMLFPGEYVSLARPGMPPPPGTELQVNRCRDAIDEKTGYWFCISRTWCRAATPVVRLYFNTGPEGAVHLVEQISERLPEDVPHCFKVPLVMAGYQRADAAVLYLEGCSFGRLRESLHAIHANVERFLRPAVPRLAKELVPGLGLAEDPEPRNESFGLHRCRLVARAIVEARRSGIVGFAPIRGVIRSFFSAAGLDPERPHLNPGTTNDYSW